MINTLFVTDHHESLTHGDLNALSFETYLRDHPKLNEPKIRVINLCDTTRYLSQGYYCSLLAEARGHQVIPSVKAINELRNKGTTLWYESSIIPKSITSDKLRSQIIVCLGATPDPCYQKLASRIFQAYAVPILAVELTLEGLGLRASLRQITLAEMDQSQRLFCLNTLAVYSKKAWRSQSKGKKIRWEMAILVNPAEKVPPSDKGAITRFIKAGEKLGIKASALALDDIQHLSQYDALFIRETTAIDHHTYRLARQAETMGLIVIDDPSSILRCCNKVFLHDAFSYKKVPCLQSRVIMDISNDTLEQLEAFMAYPMVLKMPEGSFSRGVFKVSSREDLVRVAQDMFKDSALLLVQEFMFTEFDWRIGVLNGRAIYACRYYMAKDHWQIYNHESKRFFAGGFDALPTFEVPAHVLRAAMKAASVIGNGLYGIDIKESNGRAFVLEVNDNPNIDHGVEDGYLGEELYMQIMSEFLRRLEARGL